MSLSTPDNQPSTSESSKNLKLADQPNNVPSTSAFSSKIMVNRKRQEGNPILKYIRNVPYEWSVNIRVDFECSKNCGILYLSLKYHKLHPGYIETRFNDGKNYTIKVLLVLVNVEEPSFLLRDLNMYCYRTGWSLILCYSVEEAAEYLESFKLSEKLNPETVIKNNLQYKQQKQQESAGRPPNVKEKNQQLYEHALKFLSSIRSVSQTDAKRLLGNFGSIRAISSATIDDLELCPGLGPIKAQNIHNFFRAPFLI